MFKLGALDVNIGYSVPYSSNSWEHLLRNRQFKQAIQFQSVYRNKLTVNNQIQFKSAAHFSNSGWESTSWETIAHSFRYLFNNMFFTHYWVSVFLSKLRKGFAATVVLAAEFKYTEAVEMEMIRPIEWTIDFSVFVWFIAFVGSRLSLYL